MSVKKLTGALIKSKLTDVAVPKSWCTDLNTCIEAGVYSLKEGTLNTPHGGHIYGVLLVFRSEYFNVQIILTPYQCGFFRTFAISNGNVDFNAWYQFGSLYSPS